MRTSGYRLGSMTFRKTTALVFTMLSKEALQKLEEGANQFCATCGEGLRMVAWDAEIIR